MTSQEFVNQLKKDIQAFPKIRIKHPFLKAVCNGTATMDQIRAWAIQDYQFRAAVPRIAMMRYLACNDPEIAQKLWGVVEEETRGMDTGSAGHNELAIRFANAIGLTQKTIGKRRAAPVHRGASLLRRADHSHPALVCRHVDSDRRRRNLRPGGGGDRQRLAEKLQHETRRRALLHRPFGSR